MTSRNPKRERGARPQLQPNGACHIVAARSICLDGGLQRGKQPQPVADRDMPDSQIGEARVGQPAGWPADYDFVNFIGKGEKCRVYAARKCGTELRVAVKLFASYPAWIAEARLRTYIPSSPYLVKTLDASKPNEDAECSEASATDNATSTGRHGAPPFLVVELAEGKALSEVINDIKRGQRDRATVSELVTLARGLLEALSALHDVSIILGDLSVRTVRVNADWQPRITRYRLATLQGTSSEPRVGPASTVESDLVALGILLFELADRDKYDAWRHERSKPTGLDKGAQAGGTGTATGTATGSFSGFIDSLITRELKDVKAARKRLDSLPDNARSSVTGLKPASVPPRPPSPTSSDAPASDAPTSLSLEVHAPHPNPERSSWPGATRTRVVYLLAITLAVGTLGWHIQRSHSEVVRVSAPPPPPPFNTDLTQWMDPEHPQDCIGYQLSYLPKNQIANWACGEYLSTDSALRAPADECIAENKRAAELHAQFPERPLVPVVYLVPQHSSVPATPNTPSDPTSPYKTQAVELKGLIYVQKRLNKSKTGPLIQVVLANAGDRLKYGPRVAQKLVEWKQQNERTAPVAVLGFLESFEGTKASIRILDESGIISIGTILAARFARDFRHFVAVRTTVELEVRAMLAAAADMLKGEKKGVLLVSFGDIRGTPPDADDEYRQQLRTELLRAVKEYGPTLTVLEDVKGADVDRFCTSKNAVWLYLGRWNRLRNDFAQPLNQRCSALPGGDREAVKRTVADYSAARIFDAGGGIHGDNSIFEGLRYVISGREMKCSVLPDSNALCENGSISIYAINGGRGLSMLAEAATSLSGSSAHNSRDLLSAMGTLSLHREIEAPSERSQPLPAARSSNRSNGSATCDDSVARRWEEARDPCTKLQSPQCVQKVFAPPRELSTASDPGLTGSATAINGLEPYDQDVWVVRYANDNPNNPKAACRCVHHIAKGRRSASQQASPSRFGLETQADCCCF